MSKGIALMLRCAAWAMAAMSFTQNVHAQAINSADDQAGAIYERCGNDDVLPASITTCVLRAETVAGKELTGAYERALQTLPATRRKQVA